MAKIPMGYKRVAAAFDEVARARFCESSGSDRSPENSLTDLSDLVNSFIESDERNDKEITKQVKELDDFEPDGFWLGSETTDMLLSMFTRDENDDVKRKIIDETEVACRVMDTSSQGFKRGLMTRLRERGLDAGLCKSRWEKNGRIPSGDYEYIDVKVSGTRYIVEVYLGGEFEIARATDQYNNLLNVFPAIFVGKVEELKRVVQLMCNGIKESMRSVDMHVPPWRRYGYMQAKWFGSYKRTINSVPARKGLEIDEDFGKKRSIGFEAERKVAYNCRGDFASKSNLRVGHLAAVLAGNL